ncbi:50S ribosomal protein L13 [Candidatus Gottesmanbacteria bacterium RBG_16_37_8]|uniref:Large ribosomal subunit protein uL13 n=1 Tax=Candidatus Gottesmanbacteria bacterium RBG_16_37_8 TaxID=1798371 RepID=A0A1F5YVC6_9BACT|nr:MAG: 50S ribosomal protein L13 [Candidatus Gottesmanbacteria bacterium RBG_16_37_8]
MNTHTKPTSVKDIRRNWRLYDVKGKILGRISTEIARTLVGKGKPYYVPYLDCGDYVVVVNAKDVEVTGKKRSQKVYGRYSGYPAGQKEISLQKLMENKPEEVIRHAVSGMLPNNKLRDSFLRRLYVFADDKHPYKAKFSQT